MKRYPVSAGKGCKLQVREQSSEEESSIAGESPNAISVDKARAPPYNLRSRIVRDEALQARAQRGKRENARRGLQTNEVFLGSAANEVESCASRKRIQMGLRKLKVIRVLVGIFVVAVVLTVLILKLTSLPLIVLKECRHGNEPLQSLLSPLLDAQSETSNAYQFIEELSLQVLPGITSLSAAQVWLYSTSKDIKFSGMPGPVTASEVVRYANMAGDLSEQLMELYIDVESLMVNMAIQLNMLILVLESEQQGQPRFRSLELMMRLSPIAPSSASSNAIIKYLEYLEPKVLVPTKKAKACTAALGEMKDQYLVVNNLIHDHLLQLGRATSEQGWVNALWDLDPAQLRVEQGTLMAKGIANYHGPIARPLDQLSHALTALHKNILATKAMARERQMCGPVIERNSLLTLGKSAGELRQRAQNLETKRKEEQAFAVDQVLAQQTLEVRQIDSR